MSLDTFVIVLIVCNVASITAVTVLCFMLWRLIRLFLPEQRVEPPRRPRYWERQKTEEFPWPVQPSEPQL